MSNLILASTSPARLSMLKAAGLEIGSAPARVDEEVIRLSLEAEGASPRDIADALAEAKALKVSARNPAALVIGADQTLDAGGKTVSKSESLSLLREQMLALRGTSHKLFSAAVVVQAGQPIWRHIGEARLHMRMFSDDWLDDYLTRNGDKLLGCVGGYMIEGEGVRLFDRVDGDMFTVMGLPLVPLLSWLVLRGSIPG